MSKYSHQPELINWERHLAFKNQMIYNMNIKEEDGNREQQNGALKQKFASLTEDDELYQIGRLQEQSGKLKIRLGKTEEDLNKIIASL